MWRACGRLFARPGSPLTQRRSDFAKPDEPQVQPVNIGKEPRVLEHGVFAGTAMRSLRVDDLYVTRCVAVHRQKRQSGLKRIEDTAVRPDAVLRPRPGRLVEHVEKRWAFALRLVLLQFAARGRLGA